MGDPFGGGPIVLDLDLSDDEGGTVIQNQNEEENELLHRINRTGPSDDAGSLLILPGPSFSNNNYTRPTLPATNNRSAPPRQNQPTSPSSAALPPRPTAPSRPPPEPAKKSAISSTKPSSASKPSSSSSHKSKPSSDNNKVTPVWSTNDLKRKDDSDDEEEEDEKKAPLPQIPTTTTTRRTGGLNNYLGDRPSHPTFGPASVASGVASLPPSHEVIEEDDDEDSDDEWKRKRFHKLNNIPPDDEEEKKKIKRINSDDDSKLPAKQRPLPNNISRAPPKPNNNNGMVDDKAAARKNINGDNNNNNRMETIMHSDPPTDGGDPNYTTDETRTDEDSFNSDQPALIMPPEAKPKPSATLQERPPMEQKQMAPPLMMKETKEPQEQPMATRNEPPKENTGMMADAAVASAVAAASSDPDPQETSGAQQEPPSSPKPKEPEPARDDYLIQMIRRQSAVRESQEPKPVSNIINNSINHGNTNIRASTNMRESTNEDFTVLVLPDQDGGSIIAGATPPVVYRKPSQPQRPKPQETARKEVEPPPPEAARKTAAAAGAAPVNYRNKMHARRNSATAPPAVAAAVAAPPKQQQNTATHMEIIIMFRKSGKSNPLKVAVDDTVRNVKESIEQKSGIPAEHLELIFEGVELEDRRPLAYYNIQPRSTVHLTARPPPEPKNAVAAVQSEQPQQSTQPSTQIPVSVRLPNGNALSLSIASLDKVQQLKTMIQQKEGVPVEQQRLIWNGQELEDERTVLGYNIPAGAVVYLSVRRQPPESQRRSQEPQRRRSQEPRQEIVSTPQVNDQQHVTVTVTKPTPDSKVGIAIKRHDDLGFLIDSISSTSLFARTGLESGMRILSINGRPINLNMPSKEVLSLLKTAPSRVTLVAERFNTQTNPAQPTLDPEQHHVAPPRAGPEPMEQRVRPMEDNVGVKPRTAPAPAPEPPKPRTPLDDVVDWFRTNELPTNSVVYLDKSAEYAFSKLTGVAMIQKSELTRDEKLTFLGQCMDSLRRQNPNTRNMDEKSARHILEFHKKVLRLVDNPNVALPKPPVHPKTPAPPSDPTPADPPKAGCCIIL
ncbi:Polyubiquitin (Fragment) [Seminavis robusta]|uniref:Polyubiquitin n=1 Tax=Seminavis robusta TaxID=568900 RepID=A0A9N8HI57_9STRA